MYKDEVAYCFTIDNVPPTAKATHLLCIPLYHSHLTDPKKTCPSDWNVFFYIHEDAIMEGMRLPVTVQSSPFGQVAYKVALVRCVGTDDEGDEDKVCQDFEELSSVYVVLCSFIPFSGKM